MGRKIQEIQREKTEEESLSWFGPIKAQIWQNRINSLAKV